MIGSSNAAPYESEAGCENDVAAPQESEGSWEKESKESEVAAPYESEADWEKESKELEIGSATALPTLYESATGWEIEGEEAITGASGELQSSAAGAGAAALTTTLSATFEITGAAGAPYSSLADTEDPELIGSAAGAPQLSRADTAPLDEEAAGASQLEDEAAGAGAPYPDGAAGAP